MNKVLCMAFGVSALFSPSIIMAETVHVSTPKTSLVLEATNGDPLKFVYYGNALTAVDMESLKAAGIPNFNAYPVYGLWPEKEAAMSAVHADGNMTLDMAVSGVKTRKDADGSEVTTVTMTDRVYPLTIDVNYRTFPGEDVIETWTETTHNEKGDVTLNRFMSGYLPVRRSDVHVSQFYGSWANEGKLEEAPFPRREDDKE